MGINVSKSINNFLVKTLNEIEQTGANATKNCNVGTGDIILMNNENCTTTNHNRCSDNAESTLNAISRASLSAWKEASPTQNQLLIPGVNINDTNENILELIKRMLRDKCPENSAVTQSVAESDLVFQRCRDENIPNINAGTARANCAIRTVIKTIMAADIEEKNMDLKKTNPFRLLFGGSGVISGILLIIFCAVFLLLLIIYLIATMN